MEGVELDQWSLIWLVLAVSFIQARLSGEDSLNEELYIDQVIYGHVCERTHPEYVQHHFIGWALSCVRVKKARRAQE